MNFYDKKRNTRCTRLPKTDPNTARFIKHLRKRCAYYGVELVFINEKNVYWDRYDKLGCSGYFYADDKNASMVCSIANKDNWLGILVHESCHMDQWIDSPKEFAGLDYSLGMYFSWLNDDISLKKSQAKKFARNIQQLELDCEHRSVQKIRKFGLNINIHEYIQKANTYIFSYKHVTDKRKWWSGVYNNPDIWKRAPGVLPFNLNYIPRDLNKSFNKYLK